MDQVNTEKLAFNNLYNKLGYQHRLYTICDIEGIKLKSENYQMCIRLGTAKRRSIVFNIR